MTSPDQPTRRTSYQAFPSTGNLSSPAHSEPFIGQNMSLFPFPNSALDTPVELERKRKDLRVEATINFQSPQKKGKKLKKYYLLFPDQVLHTLKT